MKSSLLLIVLCAAVLCHQTLGYSPYGYQPRIRTKFGLADSASNKELRDTDLKSALKDLLMDALDDPSAEEDSKN